MNDKKLEKILTYNYEKVLNAYLEAYGKTHGIDSEKNFRIDGDLDKTYIPSVDQEIPEILIKNTDTTLTVIVSLEAKNFYQMCTFDKMSFNFKVEEKEFESFSVSMNDKNNSLSYQVKKNKTTQAIMNFLSTLLMAIMLNLKPTLT